MFYVKCLDFKKSEHLFYINYYTCCNDFVNDCDISEYISEYVPEFTLEKYHNILIKYNAHQRLKGGEYFFGNQSDAKKCVEYLNKNYGVILKLLE